MSKRKPPEERFLTLHEPGWCEQCGERLPDLRHWRRTFCSQECANDHFNDLTAEARAEARAKLKCVVCGETIQNAKRSHQKYCSRHRSARPPIAQF